MNLSGPATVERDEKITLRLGDVLPRIPPQFLKPGPVDAKRELRFDLHDVSKDIARGRAAVPLTRIVQLCPDIFRDEIELADGIEIQLPLQKLFAQLGHFDAAAPRERQIPKAELAASTPEAFLGNPLIPDGAGSPQNQPGAESEIPAEEKISLNLSAIFRLLPADAVGQATVPDSQARIALPMRLIEPQLGAGRIEVELSDFIDALPAKMGAAMNATAGCKVWIPLDEIFQNLPSLHSFHFEPMDETPAERGLKTNGTPVVATATENKIALSGSAEPEAPIFRMVSLPPSRLFSAAAEEPAAALNEAIVAHKSISREQRLLVSIADLPGVFAAAVITSESFEKSENFPTDLDAEVFRKTLRGLCEAARYFATPLGGSRGLTLQCAHFYVSIAEQEGAWICALHRERTLSPAAHAALATAELD